MSLADELKALGLDASEDLELTPEAREAWLTALSAAVRPAELDPEEHERCIALALEDPLAPATPDEAAESARLRDALEGHAPHPDVALLTALHAGFSAAEPKAAEATAHAHLAHLPSSEAQSQKPRGNVIYAVFGAGSLVLAAAAALALTFGSLSHPSSPSAAASAPALARQRSTASLFESHFDGDTTARIDRIASVRTRELRDNRYAAWGVR